MSVGEAAVRQQLNRIHSSRAFANAERLRTLLRFLVEQTLAGHGCELKEYVIGREVCGRPVSFDPKIDPIVRVDASRLRSRLRTFYESEGIHDQVFIDLPKGAYVPEFRQRGPAPDSVVRHVSLAVLPFVNLSGSTEQEFFSDSLTEELIHLLARLSGVRVIARGSVFQFKGRTEDVRTIGRRLGVEYILEGSVRVVEERLRITVQLSEVQEGSVLWSERYERAWESVLAVQDEIAASVTDALRIQLDEHSAAVFTHVTDDPQAYEQYLRGRYRWNQRTPEALSSSVRCYEQALAQDPTCAAAHAGLAETLTVMALNDQMPTPAVMPRARAAARQAVELRPNSPEALAALGVVRAVFDWDWEGGERDLRQAVRQQPTSAVAHYLFAVLVLQPCGRWTEALNEMEIARQLDPVSPVLLRDIGMLQFMRRDWSGAEESWRRLDELAPEFRGALYWRARLAIEQERYENALTMLQARQTAGQANTRVLATIGYAYARGGDTTAASRVLNELLHLAGARRVPPLDLATVCLGLKRWDEALQWLQQSCEERAAALYQFAVDPLYDPVRADPRAQELRLAMRLPELVTAR